MTPELRQHLKAGGQWHLARLPFVWLQRERFAAHGLELRRQHGLADRELEARAAYRAMTDGSFRFWRWILALGCALVALSVTVHCQSPNVKPCLANAAAPTFLEGGATFLSCDLAGNLRTSSAAVGGGGAAQLQVRNALDNAWVNVGFNVANLTLPVTLQTGAATIGAISNTSFNVGNFPATQAVTQSTSPWVVSASGNFGVTQQTSPWVTSCTVANCAVSVNNWAGSVLGAMANYGTAPGAVLAPGVNAFVTNIPHVIVDTAPSTTVTGTVTANQGTANTAANAWPQKITDGTNTAAVKAASTAAAATDPALVVAVSPNNIISAAQSGTWTVQPGNTANTTPWLATARIVGNTGATLDAAPAAALPTNAVLIAGRDSSQTGGGVETPIVCDKSAAITATAAATVVVIALAASKTTYICGFVITGAGAAGTMQWKSGTGTTCGTGGVNLTGAMATAIGGTVSYGTGFGTIMRHASAAQDTCITMATASATAAGVVSYAQF